MGIINDINTPAEFPDNAWTQMIQAVNERNRQGAPMPPLTGVPNVGTPMPSVRSAELGKPVEDPNRQLTIQEMEELNQMALASGMVRGPVNQSIARTLGGSDEDLGPYATLEAAIAAGAPVGADDQTIAEGAQRFREPEPPQSLQPTRAFIGRVDSQPVSLPHLPDFKKVQMIDMVRGKVYVDGMEFSLEPSELKMLRKFCVTKAKDQIQAALDAALADLAEDTNGGSEAV